MSREDIYITELNYIKNDDIRYSTLEMIKLLPEYIFHEAASSTGKYHPKYTLGDCGLVRHTKAATRFAYELLNNPLIGDKYTDTEKDLMYMGIILHDGLKRGLNEEKYTRFDHPILMANYIEDNKDKLKLSNEEREFVCSVIRTHMGPWTTDYNGNEVLEKPKNKYQNFVHMCDFLASRKAILFEFDSDNNIIC